MQTVLTQLNAVPGVVGSMLCDGDGRCVAQAFPSLFDATLLGEAARVVADGTAGLELSAEAASVVDFRYGESRLLLKALARGTLLVLCSQDTNPQFLTPSLTVAASKLARLQAAPSTTPAPPTAVPVTAPAAPGDEVGGRRSPKLGVPAPTRGLEELHRRLSASKGPK